MYFMPNISEVDSAVNRAENIYIYGTGGYAEKFNSRLIENKQDARVKGFIVSNKNMDVNTIYGKPLYSIEQFNNMSDYHCLIVVAAGRRYADEISQMLKDYTNVIFLCEYVRDRDTTQHERSLFIGQSLETYNQYIADWAYHEYNVAKDEYYEKIAARRKQEIDTKQIVYIIGQESLPRNVKIMGALCRKGYKVQLILLDISTDMVKKELEGLDIKIEQCSCLVEDLMFRMLQYKPLVYYFDDRWGDCTWSNIVLEQKELFGKIIATRYDVLSNRTLYMSDYALDTERFTLEHADGIVWRWFSKERLEKQGMHFSGKSLQFLDCCSSLETLKSLELENINVTSNRKEVKLVLVSSGIGCLFRHDEKEDKYIRYAMLSEIMDKVQSDFCYLDIYTWRLTKEEEEKCKELEKKYSNLRIFKGISHDEILRRIRDCDYGILLYTGGQELPDDLVVNGRLLGINHKEAVTNKYFDYLDAGLPIVTTRPKKQIEIINQYDVVVPMDLSNLDIEYLREKRSYYKEKARIARQELSIDNQIDKMIQFMNEVAERRSIAK